MRTAAFTDAASSNTPETAKWTRGSSLLTVVDRHRHTQKTHTHIRYLGFDVAVAAHRVQILKGPPQQNYEETPEKRHHGGGEECPPHALSIIVAGDFGRERDDHVFHLRHEDRGVLVYIIRVNTVCPHRAAASTGDGTTCFG